MYLKISSAKRRNFSLGLYVLMIGFIDGSCHLLVHHSRHNGLRRRYLNIWLLKAPWYNASAIGTVGWNRKWKLNSFLKTLGWVIEMICGCAVISNAGCWSQNIPVWYKKWNINVGANSRNLANTIYNNTSHVHAIGWYLCIILVGFIIKKNHQCSSKGNVNKHPRLQY